MKGTTPQHRFRAVDRMWLGERTVQGAKRNEAACDALMQHPSA
ncbi:hypothetical protein HMPREF0972_01564 [Actinomyces sp. oral taxon 848 str. F0332]|nr:hypothetical protein HMPREF0972_01564 [Actinomyces sp. oral taxon 848 str. F0332]